MPASRFRPTTIGQMRTRITLESPSLATDAGGAQSETWSSQGSVWSKWINAHGAESLQDDALQSEKRATVTIRHRSDVTTAWAVVKDGERYAILSIDHIQERQAFIEMQVQLLKASA
jgi:SPP1 family predicted phage head-tail adaptor